MSLPFFYVKDLNVGTLQLDEDTSRHIVQVLRMAKGEQVLLTDGSGKRAKAEILEEHRKKCPVSITSVETEKEKDHKIAIAISLLKNASRFEWFLEKATEIGVSEIIPLLCERTEREKFRQDRMQGILVSAMLQSQQCWMPELQPPSDYEKVIQLKRFNQKFIAHCAPGHKQTLPHYSPLLQHYSSLILIGPEGDFTPAEIAAALENQFKPVSLGNTRLRTETAGVVAGVILSL
jgi:16S rRNA (uracil1498-N3)-methyltransferase